VGDALAARLRRTGAGAFVGALRAVPRAGGGRQRAGVLSDDAGAVLPSLAPPGLPQVAKAADRDDAEEPLAPAGGALAARRAGERQVPADPARPAAAGARSGAADRAVHRQDLLRARRGAEAARRSHHRAGAARAALSALAARPGARARRVRSRRRAGVGAGRAGQHGREELHLRAAARAGRASAGARGDAGGERVAGDRIAQGARDRAGRHREPGLCAHRPIGIERDMASVELRVPALGESISEALIAKWLKRVGETIAVDEPVVDLETDKVSVSINAPSAGVLAEQRFAEGATVKVGDVVGAISSEPEVQPK